MTTAQLTQLHWWVSLYLRNLFVSKDLCFDYTLQNVTAYNCNSAEDTRVATSFPTHLDVKLVGFHCLHSHSLTALQKCTWIFLHNFVCKVVGAIVLPGLTHLGEYLSTTREHKILNYLEEWKVSLLVMSHYPKVLIPYLNLHTLPSLLSRDEFIMQEALQHRQMYHCFAYLQNIIPSILQTGTNRPHSNAKCKLKFYTGPATELNRYFQISLKSVYGIFV